MCVFDIHTCVQCERPREIVKESVCKSVRGTFASAVFSCSSHSLENLPPFGTMMCCTGGLESCYSRVRVCDDYDYCGYATQALRRRATHAAHARKHAHAQAHKHAAHACKHAHAQAHKHTRTQTHRHTDTQTHRHRHTCSTGFKAKCDGLARCCSCVSWLIPPVHVRVCWCMQCSSEFMMKLLMCVFVCTVALYESACVSQTHTHTHTCLSPEVTRRIGQTRPLPSLRKIRRRRST